MTKGKSTRGTRLIRAVDSVAATQGFGVLLIEHERLYRLRPQGASAATVVIELRDPLPISPFLKKNSTAADFERYSKPTSSRPNWSLMPDSASRLRKPGLKGTPRTPSSQVVAEWRALGFNCGGTVLAWMGAAGTLALAPASGGGSLFATGAAVAGALASSYQCVFSVQKTRNAMQGKFNENKTLDDEYFWSMQVADIVGLAGAGAALKEVWALNKMAKASGSTIRQAGTQPLDKITRQRLSAAFGLDLWDAGTRTINNMVRQKVMDAVGGAVGIVGSFDSGVLKQVGQTVVVWITTEYKGA